MLGKSEKGIANAMRIYPLGTMNLCKQVSIQSMW